MNAGLSREGQRTVVESPVTVPNWKAPGDTRVAGRRLVQGAIDLAASSIVPLLSLGLFLFVPVSTDGSGIDVPSLVAVSAVVVVIAVTAHGWYWVVRPAGERGQTWGMQLLRIRVVQANGVPVTAGPLAVRWLMLAVDGLGFGLVGLVAMAVSPRRQRLGDMVAGTVVIRDRPR